MGMFAVLAMLTAVSSSAQASVRPPMPFLSPGPPSGWEREGSLGSLTGNVVSYRLSQAPPAAEQYISAKAYSGISDLGRFVAAINANLQNLKSFNLLREDQTTICGGEPASEIEFSEAGLVPADPDRILNVEQVRTVKDGWAYVSTYIRPTESPKRPDAEQWIRAFCQSPG